MITDPLFTTDSDDPSWSHIADTFDSDGHDLAASFDIWNSTATPEYLKTFTLTLSIRVTTMMGTTYYFVFWIKLQQSVGVKG